MLKAYEEVERTLNDLKALEELCAEDPSLEAELSSETTKVIPLLEAFELRSMLSGSQDTSNAYIRVQAGAGGTEACDWAQMLVRMYTRWAERRGFKVEIEDVAEGGMALMPMIGRARLLRTWGGVMDMSMDGSPIIDKTHVEGLYFNGGWCYGGFKATPASGWCFAHLLATDTPHRVATAYRFDRFLKGLMIDEKGQGATPNLH